MRENALSRPNRPFFTHSVIHIQKAVHLRIQKIRLKFDFRHPVERQIFGDGDGLDPALILELCLKGHKSLGSLGSVVKGLIVSLVGPTKGPRDKVTY